MRQNSHASVETNSNKRRSVLGTNHTKIYRVNLVEFKHSAEDPSRSPHHQNKYTLRSKRFSNVLSKHQGRFLETVPEAKTLTNRVTYHKRPTLMILYKKFAPSNEASRIPAWNFSINCIFNFSGQLGACHFCHCADVLKYTLCRRPGIILFLFFFSGRPGACHFCHSFGLYPGEPI